MDVSLEMKLVAGTGAGGEDLFLVIKARMEHNGTDQELIDALKSGAQKRAEEAVGCLVDPEYDSLEDALADYDYEHLVSDGKEVASGETVYGFQLRESRADFVNRLGTVLGDPSNWVAKRRLGEPRATWKLKVEQFVDGNAD